MPSTHDTQPELPRVGSRLAVPYGLFLVLGLYGLLVLGYVWASFWNAPAYRAAEHHAQGTQLLGADDGRKADPATLARAANHLLEAARLMPQVKALHERVEAMRFRFDERGLQLPRDYVRHAETLSALYTRLEAEQAPLLVVGVRHQGWAVDQLLEGPRKAFLLSLPGAGLLVLLWACLRFSGRARRARDHEAELKQAEADVERLGSLRKPPTPTPDRSRTPRP